MADNNPISNKAFAETNQASLACCEKAKVKATKRQASKFRNQKGLAYAQK